MNTFEINKIVGAILMTVLAMTVISMIGDILVPEQRGEEQAAGAGHAAATPETAAATPSSAAVRASTAANKPVTAAASAPASEPAAAASLAERLAAADPARGEKIARKCKSCHTLEKGGGHKVGPNLWGVVGRAKGSAPGYNYSAAMQNAGGEWTYEDLDRFLTDPKAFVPGTKMPFKLRKAESRADLLVYLRTLADSPPPLPGQ